MKKSKFLLAFFLILIPVFSLGKIIFDPELHYFSRYYTHETYKNLEKLYNQSQYRLKNPTSLIADEVVFRYASGAYIRGVDPILINSEITPLGKYMIGLSYQWFQTESPVILLSAMISLVAIWFLGKAVLRSGILALVPIVLFTSEKLFMNQLVVTPLLDIIQLPFILLTLYSFSRRNFFWSGVFLGFTAATKSVVPAFLLVLTFFIFSFVRKQKYLFVQFLPWLSVSFAILMLSYTKTFLNGYTFWDFLGFQKWILLYQQSKLIYPFSFWKLMLFNQWQTWWGDMAVIQTSDWSFAWPILVIVPFVYILKRKFPDTILLLLIWVFVYEAFLSLGVISTRFLLPLLPILYILAIKLIQKK